MEIARYQEQIKDLHARGQELRGVSLTLRAKKRTPRRG